MIIQSIFPTIAKIIMLVIFAIIFYLIAQSVFGRLRKIIISSRVIYFISTANLLVALVITMPILTYSFQGYEEMTINFINFVAYFWLVSYLFFLLINICLLIYKHNTHRQLVISNLCIGLLNIFMAFCTYAIIQYQGPGPVVDIEFSPETKYLLVV